MRTPIASAIILSVMLVFSTITQAQATGAKATGVWNDSSIWTLGTVPGGANDVYIGSLSPAPVGSATDATVTLTQDQSAYRLYLGNGNGAHGTLDLAGHKLAIVESLYLDSGSTINHANGYIEARYWTLNNGIDFTFAANDKSTYGLDVKNGSSVTITSKTNLGPTTPPGSSSYYLNVKTGSTLNLGANIDLSAATYESALRVEDAGSELHMNGYNITADKIYLGWLKNNQLTIDRGATPGSFTADTFLVGGNTFDLLPIDSVKYFDLTSSQTTLNHGISVTSLEIDYASTATTTTSDNIRGFVHVYEGSNLEMGADLKLNSGLTIRDTGSIVHMNGHDIVVQYIEMGGRSTQFGDVNQAVTLDRGATPGSIKARDVYVYNSPFNLLPTDEVTNLSISNSATVMENGVTVSSLSFGKSTATIKTTENVSENISVYNGTLNMDADVDLTEKFIADQLGTVIHMNGHDIKAAYISLGSPSGEKVILDRGQTPGSLTATNLAIGKNNSMDLLAIDKIENFYVSGSSTNLSNEISISSLTLERVSNGTTTATNNITDSVSVKSGSTLNVGANLNLLGSLNIEDTNSVVHLNNHDVSADSIYLGWNSIRTVTLDRGITPGIMKATNLYVQNTMPILLTTDSVTNLFLRNAAFTATDLISIPGSIAVTVGSVLNMDTNLNLSGDLAIDELNSAVHMNGHSIVANSLHLGWQSDQQSNLDRGAVPGSLTVTNLYARNNQVNILDSDRITNLTLTSGSRAKTVTTDTLSGSVTLTDKSALDLADDLVLTGNLDVQGSKSTINANGFDVTADHFFTGSNKDIAFNNFGSVYLNGLHLEGSTLIIHGGVIEDLISYSGNTSVMTILETNGTGLTFNGEFEGLSGRFYMLNMFITEPGWAFRWQNDSPGSNHVTELENLIASAQIGLLVTPGIDYHVYDQGGYTYIGTTPVPEAGSLALAGVVCAGCLAARVLQQRSRRAKLHVPS